MKRALFVLLMLLLSSPAAAQAQTAVTLESLTVEIWPDYDKESVLVLLTGTLSPNIPLPATVTIPLPDGVEFNVVARITPDNVMTDQGIPQQLGTDQVTFTIPDNRFRVEYYQPYQRSDTERTFTYSWQSDIAVEQMNVTVQQPFAATNMTVRPTPASILEEQDGLTYHLLPGQPVPAGDVYNVEVAYSMSAPALTVSFLTDETATEEELPFLDAVPVEESSFNWTTLLVGLGVLILATTAVWYLTSNRSTAGKRRPAKPKPKRQNPASQTAAAPGKANFCHHCGEPVQEGDKFCRNCGTAVKGT